MRWRRLVEPQPFHLVPPVKCYIFKACDHRVPPRRRLPTLRLGEHRGCKFADCDVSHFLRKPESAAVQREMQGQKEGFLSAFQRLPSRDSQETMGYAWFNLPLRHRRRTEHLRLAYNPKAEVSRSARSPRLLLQQTGGVCMEVKLASIRPAWRPIALQRPSTRRWP